MKEQHRYSSKMDLSLGYLVSPQVQKLYLATGNDRLKLLVLYSGEEDERLRKAAAGTLAMLTAEQPELCARIPGTVRTPSSVQQSLFQSCCFSSSCATAVFPQTTHWLEIVQALLLSDIPDLRHRGVVIIQNMMQAEKTLAETLMESEALEILSVLAKGGEGAVETVSRIAQNCLDQAIEYGIIKTREGK